MTAKVFDKILTIILTIVLMPIIAAYCLLWVVMTVGGGSVKLFLGKKHNKKSRLQSKHSTNLERRTNSK